MGTRAQFFVGNPEDVENRRWLGTTAWDGYPDGWIAPLAKVMSEEGFVNAVKDLAGSRDDFCDPAKHGFPFPWTDDLFLTDYTYAWFDGRVMMTCYHRGWVELRAYLNGDDASRGAYHNDVEQLSRNVPAPTSTWDRSGPDSIVILRTSR